MWSALARQIVVCVGNYIYVVEIKYSPFTVLVCLWTATYVLRFTRLFQAAN